ncbi:hypothetical protein [Paenibacillus agricola]|uniref:Hydrolase n=1 Tax=Paenibacillus agricola TaxID=2716264 RepID=A0ABX0J4I2_9BACL|nr:hypothetical protein [Paenibacillus agricola]NHN31199.1 hypothetical protein [Paenibacillus agricola]
MDKKTYYVAVGSSEILEPEDMTGNFEFEIIASEEEVDQLQELFEENEDAHDDTYIRSHLPFPLHDNNRGNSTADYYMTQIYSKLHQLGTHETKAHIESMNILP